MCRYLFCNSFFFITFMQHLFSICKGISVHVLHKSIKKIYDYITDVYYKIIRINYIIFLQSLNYSHMSFDIEFLLMSLCEAYIELIMV
jgi:hypothetical protein